MIIESKDAIVEMPQFTSVINNEHSLQDALVFIQKGFEYMACCFRQIKDTTDIFSLVKVNESLEGSKKQSEKNELLTVFKNLQSCGKQIQGVCRMIYQFLTNNSDSVSNQLGAINMESAVEVVNKNTEDARNSVRRYRGQTDITSLCQVYDNNVTAFNNVLNSLNCQTGKQLQAENSNLAI
jgi:mannose-6-phosphate isomerase class I